MNNKKNYKIWFPVDIMKDPRTVKLLDETGYKGLGVLFSAIAALSHFYMYKPTVDEVLILVGNQVPLKFRRKILFNYGFFNIDKNGNIEVILESDSRAGVCVSECAEECAEVCAEECASLPAPRSLTQYPNSNINSKTNRGCDNAHTPTEILEEAKASDPHHSELWEGVLLYCPDHYTPLQIKIITKYM